MGVGVFAVVRGKRSSVNAGRNCPTINVPVACPSAPDRAHNFFSLAAPFPNGRLAANTAVRSPSPLSLSFLSPLFLPFLSRSPALSLSFSPTAQVATCSRGYRREG